MVTSCMTEVAYTPVLNGSEQCQTRSDALYNLYFLPNIYKMMK